MKQGLRIEWGILKGWKMLSKIIQFFTGKKFKKKKSKNVNYYKYYKLNGRYRKHLYKITVQNDNGLVIKSRVRNLPLCCTEISKEEYDINAKL